MYTTVHAHVYPFIKKEDNMSDLERIRLRNVKRNERMLIELGLKKVCTFESI